MTIERFETGPRIDRAAARGDTAHLADLAALPGMSAARDARVPREAPPPRAPAEARSTAPEDRVGIVVGVAGAPR